MRSHNLTMSADAELHALGQFTYEFSRLQWHLRHGLVQMIMVDVPLHTQSARLRENIQRLTSSDSMRALLDSFFGVARAVGDYDSDEELMAAALRKELLRLVETRNDLMHGEWSIGGHEAHVNASGQILSVPREAALSRDAAYRRDGGLSATHRFSPQGLRELAAGVAGSRRKAWEWSHLAAGTRYCGPLEANSDRDALLGPRDIFQLREGRLERTGPLADSVAPPVSID